MEKLRFLTRVKNNADTEVAYILVAIYINLINMVNAFTNHEKDFIFSIVNYCK